MKCSPKSTFSINPTSVCAPVYPTNSYNSTSTPTSMGIPVEAASPSISEFPIHKQKPGSATTALQGGESPARSEAGNGWLPGRAHIHTSQIGTLSKQ